MTCCSDFWGRLAQHHAEVQDTNFDLASVRRLLPEMESPVLVVRAGQGLIVAELRQRGHECDGVDLSSERIRQTNLRQGMMLIQADATALPVPKIEKLFARLDVPLRQFRTFASCRVVRI